MLKEIVELPVVVKTPTYEEFVEVQKVVFNEGGRWAGGQATFLSKPCWGVCKENTAIKIYELMDSCMQYADIPFYENRSYTIITFFEFMEKMGKYSHLILNSETKRKLYYFK